MYDNKYAQAWIADHKSGKDVSRAEFIMPFLSKAIQDLPDYARILDVGCGWGIAIPYLKATQQYIGVDVTTDFFDYIRKNYSHTNITLQEGGLPDRLDFEDNFFDLVVSSMSLHTVRDVSSSISNMFSKVRPEGKLILVDFDNRSEKRVSDRFKRGIIQEGYCRGIYTLDSGLEVEAEVFFHREEDYEKELRKHGSFTKTELGPIFVGYEIKK